MAGRSSVSDRWAYHGEPRAETAFDSESTLVIGDVRSPVLARGPADAAEAVVFVHGVFGSKEDWADLMGRLSPEVRAVAPDMPGYGAASRPRDFDYTVEGYSRHLAACLDQLGIDRAHLVLHTQRKRLHQPDKTEVFPGGESREVHLGEFLVARTYQEPGWRWSKDVKPIVGTASCRFQHTGVVLRGRARWRMDDGSELVGRRVAAGLQCRTSTGSRE